MSKVDENGMPILNEGEFCFGQDHPGRRYCCLKKSTKIRVAKLSIPKGTICDLDDLKLSEDNPSAQALQSRENYAKVALVLFYPFRNNSIFSVPATECLWNKLMNLIKTDNNSSKFFKEGKKILQNMQDNIQARKCQIPIEELKKVTKSSNNEENNCKNGVYDSYDEYSEFGDADSVEAYEEKEADDGDWNDDTNEARCLNDLKKGENLMMSKIIESRQLQEQSIFLNDNSLCTVENSNVYSENLNSYSAMIDGGANKYKTLLAFVSGAIVGSTVSHGSESIETSDEDVSNPSNGDQDESIDLKDWVALGFPSNFDKQNIPSMRGIAEMVSKNKGISLDQIQYVAYEVICSSFLLNLLNDDWKKNSDVVSDFTGNDDELQDERTHNIKQTLQDKLKQIGAKDQLLMFVTGPAGAGKSTAIELAQQFCFEFCKSLDLIWNRNTFLFTAVTGCAAALFGGVTLHSATFLNSKSKNISEDMMKIWDQVRMLIIDECSFSYESMMEKLNDKLNHTRRKLSQGHEMLSPTMIFGGYSIIFVGDFCQLPPVKVKESQLLYASHGLWENSINVAIVLNNSHRFKDDPEYGEILKRMWDGTFTREDCNKINKRLLGGKVSLPKVDCDADISYACWKNSERVTIHACTFQKHISNFPSVDCNENPPEHTVVLEADIRHAPKHKPRKNKNKNDDSPLPARITPELRNKIYARCGDSDMKDQNKQIDPALKLYVGAHCMIIDNDDISKGRANGTLCRVIGIKRKTNQPLKWKNYDGKKVYTTNVSDVEYVEFEHFPKKVEQISLENKIEMLQEQIKQDPQNIKNSKELKNVQAELNKFKTSQRFKLTAKNITAHFTGVTLIHLKEDSEERQNPREMRRSKE